MDLQLAGKTAFVSGSTRGIGFAIARGLLDEGAAVIVNGRDAAGVDSAVEELGSLVAGAEVTGLVADLADADQVRDLAAPLAEVDVLVNNVGHFEVKAFADVTDDDWQRYFDVNVMSGVRLSRLALPHMLERGWGRILFVGTESSVNVPADMVHYGATKAAALAVGNGLAKLTRGTEVTVNTVLGGPTYSDGVARAISQVADAQSVPAEDLKAAIGAGNPTSLLQRFLDPREVADLAVYLASPRASATNGAALRADGGVLTSVL